ncbi:TM1266 family iron-only hydrogenase system putative regulator [Abyssisolibacter fermentans]|uniref:TM1266 family iron-only hydrogenase system putative regulator n=1 Tax=Abyssisolibacter fermentans TaxID=1766203 RepID=UPI0008368785|nr:TM1266 family iron-only hydrogenase system putative regulator [Abyssisolibacter fermentans]
MKRVAVISAILENPIATQAKFNDIVSEYKGLIKGRMGLPLSEEGITVICITVIGKVDEINSLTGKLGRLDSVQVKTSISKQEF